jgi:hypothetical protein
VAVLTIVSLAPPQCIFHTEIGHAESSAEKTLLEEYLQSTYSQHHTSWCKTKYFSPYDQDQDKNSTLTTSIQIILEILANAIIQKRNKKDAA